jgi:hypothetical protein
MKALILIAWIGGCGADAASTHYALARGGHEAVLTQNRYVNTAIIGSAAAVGAYGSTRWAKRHPRAAALLSVGVAGLRIGIAARNVRAVR